MSRGRRSVSRSTRNRVARLPKVYGDRIQQDIEARVSIEDELLKLAAKGD